MLLAVPTTELLPVRPCTPLVTPGQGPQHAEQSGEGDRAPVRRSGLPAKVTFYGTTGWGPGRRLRHFLSLVKPERIQGGDGIREASLVAQGDVGLGGRGVGPCQGLQTWSRSAPRVVAWSGLSSWAAIPLGTKGGAALPCSVTSGDET